MLEKPDTIDADDIAKYAVFNTTDNDSEKSLNICDLICAYTGSVKADQTASLEEMVKQYKILYEELEANQEPLENRAILAEASVKELEEVLTEALQHMETNYRYEPNDFISTVLEASIKKAKNALNPKHQ